MTGVVCATGYAGKPKVSPCDALKGGDYTISGCAPVRCPDNTNGGNVADGCTCKPGFSGRVRATSKAPFYESTCAHVPCPANSTGTNVASGDCKCDTGWEGQVTASAVFPYYVSTCAPVVCTRPSETDGYLLRERNLKVASFDVTVECEEGFRSGAPKAAACDSRRGGPYVLSGCDAIMCDGSAIVMQASRRAESTAYQAPNQAYKSKLVFLCLEDDLIDKQMVTFTCERTGKFETNETCGKCPENLYGVQVPYYCSVG